MEEKITEQTVFENLKDFRDVAKDLGIKYWLCEGLLLGLYRDGRPVTGDEDDTDIAIREVDEKQRAMLLGGLMRKGFAIHVVDINGKAFVRDRVTVNGYFISMQVVRNGNRIDIMIFREKDSVCWFGGGSDDHPYYLVFPSKFFTKQGTIDWKGETFTTVPNIEEFLEYKYYKWRVPNLRKDGYDYSDPKINRAYTNTWSITNPKDLLPCEE